MSHGVELKKALGSHSAAEFTGKLLGFDDYVSKYCLYSPDVACTDPTTDMVLVDVTEMYAHGHLFVETFG